MGGMLFFKNIDSRNLEADEKVLNLAGIFSYLI